MMASALAALNTTATKLLLLVALVLFLLWRLLSWHSEQLELSYKQGFTAAETEYLRQLGSAVDIIEAQRKSRAKIVAKVRTATQKIEELENEARTLTGDCGLSSTGLGLWNETIDTANDVLSNQRD